MTSTYINLESFMKSFYLLRLYGTDFLFAGFKPTDKVGVFQPVFVEPAVGRAVQANVIHADDLPETEKDLLKYGITCVPLKVM